MWVKRLADCTEIVANDLCRLRELMHPAHDGLHIGYSLAHARVEPGARTLRHHLEGASEVYYLLSGRGTMHIDGQTRDVAAGDAVLISPGAVQFLVNTGEIPIEFLAIVEPAWQPQIDHRDEDA
jgi:mannose-6-phosphate isomerase-like protein (cupin superfamily)